MANALRELEGRLHELEAAGLGRAMLEPAGLDFCSNDYLGLSTHPEVRAGLLRRLLAKGPTESLGAPASRLLRGQFEDHRAIEERLAAIKGTEAALLFPSGYMANLGLLCSILGPQDRVLSDAQNHASIIDAIRLSGCNKEVYPHLDVAALEELLATPYHMGHTYLITESLFSMDGDIAPLDRYATLCRRYGANLIVDDAHGFGVYGDRSGSGLTEYFGVTRRAFAIVSTLGKAMGAQGAFVAGPRVVKDYLINRARAFIFTTAVSPVNIAHVDAALDVARDNPDLRTKVLANSDRLRAQLRTAGHNCLKSAGPIVPLVLGNNRVSLEVARRVRAHGFDVRAIRPPTVAAGTARLRLSVHADHSEADIDRLASVVCRVVTEEGLREAS